MSRNLAQKTRARRALGLYVKVHTTWLDDVYAQYSQNKQLMYDRFRHSFAINKGRRFRIIEHNQHTFTAGYVYYNHTEDMTMFHYMTSRFEVNIPFEEE